MLGTSEEHRQCRGGWIQRSGGAALRSTATFVCALLMHGVHAVNEAPEVAELKLDVSARFDNRVDVQWVHAGQPSDGAASTGPLQVSVIASDARDPANRVLAQASFESPSWRQGPTQTLGKQISLLQVLVTGGGPMLTAYANAGVRQFPGTREAEAQPLPSIYRTESFEFNADIRFARDVTGDGLDDLLLPDFTGWRFAAAAAEGGFADAQLFGPEPVMNAGSARYINFTAHEPYLFDHNRDGTTDIGFWQDDGLAVYHQSASHQFATEPVRFDVGGDVESDAFFTLTVGTDEDNPGGRQALLDAIEDLNGDGLPDMLVYSVTGEGLFGKETRYEVHLGEIGTDGSLRFEEQPSSVVGSGGIQIDVEREDLDGDGQLEMLVTSFDLGIGSIIRGLISRTASLRLAIYRLRDGRYPGSPSLTRKITAKLDLANGDIFVPAVRAGDLDGDGRKELLVQDGADKLKGVCWRRQRADVLALCAGYCPGIAAQRW